MNPYLFDIAIWGHHITPPSYGIFLALGFSAAYFDSIRRGKKAKENLNHIENLFLLTVLGSVIGSRLFHVLFEDFDYYLDHPWKVFAVWQGGYTFYGAVIMVILFIFTYCRSRKISFLTYADLASPATMLGLFFGRIGCFLAGCCWGKIATGLPWAVKFTHPDAFCTLRGVPLHPTQIYESLGGLFIYIYTNWRWKKRQFKGQVFFETMIGYSILRFIIEHFRGDEIRGYIFHGLLSYSQFISLIIFLCAIIGMFYQGGIYRKLALFIKR